MQTYAGNESHRRFPLIRLLLILGVIAFAVWFAPRVLDRTPPSLSVEGLEPGGRYRGVVSIAITGEDSGQGLDMVRVTRDGQFLAEIRLQGKQARTTYPWDTTSLSDGVYLIQVELTDASIWHKSSRAQFDVIVDNTPPEIALLSVPENAIQGQTISFFVKSDETLRKAEGSFLDRKIPFFSSGTRMRTFVGIQHNANAGTYRMEVRAWDLAGNENVTQMQVVLKKGDFKTGRVNLSQKKRSLLTDRDKKQTNRERRAQALETSSSRQIWNGLFKKPTRGVTTSTFGARRVYNSGVVRSVHLGWDIANRKGTDVFAANDGIVVLAEELPIHGNNILLDHGQGVFSGYAHLNEILVSVGDDVQKGQLIGRMGTTGQSTGSHLHWEMFVQGVPVDPAQWLTQDFRSP